MHLNHVPDSCRDDFEAARDIARRFLSSLKRDPDTRRRERSAGHWLALEWYAIIAVTFAIIYLVRPASLKLALLIPWSLYASLALDNITHYANHWPLFKSPRLNALWRYSGVLVYSNALEIKHVHTEHHLAYSRPSAAEERVFGEDLRGKSFWVWLARETLDAIRLLNPVRALPPCVADLERTLPSHYKEIVTLRFGFVAVTALLLLLDARDTLLFYLPSVMIIGSAASLIMNLTDHIPGDPTHPFRLATHLEPANALETVYSKINHYTAATHLTHHLFPATHWLHLPALQRELASIYARHHAPRSLMVNSTLIGNPLRLLWVLKEIEARRFDADTNAISR